MPSVAEEDDRRLHRERSRLINERIQHVNRIKGLLAIHGIYDYQPLRRDRMQRLERLCTAADGRTLPPRIKAEILRELQRLELAIAIPLLVPSFLWAIGLSQVRIALGFPSGGPLLGATSAVLAFLAPSVPLVTYITLVSARRLSKGQVDAVRLVGGEPRLFCYGARAVLPGAVLTAMLAGILTLSDPGPGQILGYSGIAYDTKSTSE